MFNVGDIVEIHYHGEENGWFPMEGSPVKNLEGSIARISEIKKLAFQNDSYYRLEFIDINAKDLTKFESSMGDLIWKDRHLIPHTDININTDDLLKLL